MDLETECIDGYLWDLENDDIGVGLDLIVHQGRLGMKLEGQALIAWVRRALTRLAVAGAMPSAQRFVGPGNPHGLAHFGADTPAELVDGVIASWVADGMPDLEWWEWRLNTPKNRVGLAAAGAAG